MYLNILDARSGDVQRLWFVFLWLDPHRASSLPTLMCMGSRGVEPRWHSPVF